MVGRRGNPHARVLMLALDAVSLSFIRENLESFPTIKGLLDEGRLVEMQNTADLASASVWPTFASGKMPGEHGHYYPFQWKANQMRFVRSGDKAWDGELDYKAFWHDLACHGIDCLVFDAVHGMPLPDTPCLEVNNWSAQSSGKTQSSDPEVLGEIKRRFGKRPIGKEVPVAKTRRMASTLLKQSLESLKRKTDAIIWLGQSNKWQFYLASIQDVHRAGHNLWPTEQEFASDAAPDSLLEVYRAMDSELARILEAFRHENTAIILFSLHGMAPNKAQNHFLPLVLNHLNNLYLTGIRPSGISTRRNGVIARLRDQIPPFIQYAATNVLGEEIQDWVVNREFTGGVDWSVTPSFPVVTGGEGMIRLNLKGRERNGMLPPDGEAYRRYIKWLGERIADIRVEQTGEPLVSEIIMMQDHYPGGHSHFLPDIALKWAPRCPVTAICSDDIGIIKKKLLTGRGGNHTGEAFALIAGKTPDAETLLGLNHIKDYRDFVSALLT